MRLRLINISLTGLALFLFGCASTETSENNGDGSYTLTAEQADQALVQAIRDGWPNTEIEKVEN